jgi:hypothetical protein
MKMLLAKRDKRMDCRIERAGMSLREVVGSM